MHIPRTTLAALAGMRPVLWAYTAYLAAELSDTDNQRRAARRQRRDAVLARFRSRLRERDQHADANVRAA